MICVCVLVLNVLNHITAMPSFLTEKFYARIFAQVIQNIEVTLNLFFCYV